MTFTDEIREEADRMWEAILDHPMVRELGRGRSTKRRFGTGSGRTTFT